MTAILLSPYFYIALMLLGIVIGFISSTDSKSKEFGVGLFSGSLLAAMATIPWNDIHLWGEYFLGLMVLVVLVMGFIVLKYTISMLIEIVKDC